MCTTKHPLKEFHPLPQVHHPLGKGQQVAGGVEPTSLVGDALEAAAQCADEAGVLIRDHEADPGQAALVLRSTRLPIADLFKPMMRSPFRARRRPRWSGPRSDPAGSPASRRPRVAALRRSSREIVDGARPSDRATARTPRRVERRVPGLRAGPPRGHDRPPERRTGAGRLPGRRRDHPVRASRLACDLPDILHSHDLSACSARLRANRHCADRQLRARRDEHGALDR